MVDQIPNGLFNKVPKHVAPMMNTLPVDPERENSYCTLLHHHERLRGDARKWLGSRGPHLWALLCTDVGPLDDQFALLQK